MEKGKLMKKRYIKIRGELNPVARSGTESRGAFGAVNEASFERLKSRLLTQSIAERSPDLNTPLRRAANEAASLAWMTSFPLLFFPVLFEEIAADAARHESLQRKIRRSSPRFDSLAE